MTAIIAAFNRVRSKAAGAYHEYPSQFWLLTGSGFIDMLGGTMIFPFFTLYITDKFGVSMTQVGLLFGVFSITNAIGSTIGGALTDSIGRKAMKLAGLVLSALSSLALGFTNDFRLFILVVVGVGMLSSLGQPAGQAMVADLLPPEKRNGGFAIQRINFNLAVTFGPAIGGLLAGISFLYIFIGDAVTSLFTAVIVLLFLHETRPPKAANAAEPEHKETVLQSLAGYGKIAQNKPFVAFMLISTLAWVVFLQLNSILAPYLRNVHGVPPQGFGLLMTINAGMVVLFQYWVANRIRAHHPLKMMALGVAVGGAGFALFGVATTYPGFIAAVVVSTIGELIAMPPSQVLVAQFAPEDMRGRYIAAFGYTWMTASALGPLMSGLIMDNSDPRLVWAAVGVIGLVTALLLMWLARDQAAAPVEVLGAEAASAD